MKPRNSGTSEPELHCSRGGQGDALIELHGSAGVIFSLVLSPLGKRRSHLLPCPRGRPQTSSQMLSRTRGRPRTSSHRVSRTLAPWESIKKIIPSHFRLSRIYQKNNFPCKAPNRPAVAFFPWPLSPPSFPCEVASEGLFEPLSTISLERKVSRGYVGD